MSTKKVISINPEFFKLSKHGSKKERNKKKDKSKRDSILSSSINKSLKKDLLNKIKQHQQKRKNDDVKQRLIEDSNTDTDDNLKDSINFLNNIAKKRKEKQEKSMMKRNKTLKNNTIHKEPKYGCLKNGSLPTFKQYNKTLKNNNNNNSTIPNKKPPISFADTPVHTESFEQRQNKLSNIKAKFNNNISTSVTFDAPLPFPNTNSPSNNIMINNIPKINEVKREKKKRKRKMKTLKRKITLGKRDNIVGVLIKNKKTRKNVKREVKNLEKKSITNIKKYLRKHNLIKIGSTAPDDVLRKIYENSYLAGDIYNNNTEMLIHNFMGN
mgnify:CR=1 FL=1|tara:strand:- start:1384 stop:2358 length:975 start_codon:yes stop_codon:yes gene_type:complete